MKLHYVLLDVFTSERLKGNQLAVVLDADGLLDNEMQAIAAEFNLSETVFLCRPRSERNTSAVRIFTPRIELPFAGHPTVGAAVCIGLHQKVPIVRIEETVGVITAVVDAKGRGAGHATFGLPKLPEEVGQAPDPVAIGRALGLGPEEIGLGTVRAAIWSAGVPFYLVPVRDAGALARAKPQRAIWPLTFADAGGSVYVYTLTPDEPGNDYAARMFAPGMGIDEDPGTGAAAAALIGPISRSLGLSDGQVEVTLRQGFEMGRPCRIAMQIRNDRGVLTRGGIGGDAVVVGEGTLDLGD